MVAPAKAPASPKIDKEFDNLQPCRPTIDTNDNAHYLTDNF